MNKTSLTNRLKRLLKWLLDSLLPKSKPRPMTPQQKLAAARRRRNRRRLWHEGEDSQL